MSHPLSISAVLGAGNSGLTLVPTLLNTDGTAAAGLTTTTLLELAAGSGTYLWTGTIPDGFRGALSFSSGATFKAAVAINPEEGENLDVRVSTRLSAGSGANTVTLTFNSSAGGAAAGVSVTIKNVAEDTLIAGPLATDSSGHAVFLLDAGTYHVLVNGGVRFSPLAAQALVVSGTTTASYTLTAVASPSPPASASLCRVWGYLRHMDGTAAASIPLTFRLRGASAFIASGAVLVVTQVTVTTDATGYFQADLTRSSQLVGITNGASTQYEATAPALSLSGAFTVPDVASVDFSTLSFS